VAVLSSVDLSRLIVATAKRDAGAFEQLYAASCAKVYGVVLRILRRHDLAADVVEESYLQIWQDAEQFNPAQISPMAWMVAIARSITRAGRTLLQVTSQRSPTPKARACCRAAR
jgi:RNA polymerase sigma-70 factor (ECF subfamily)